MDLEDIKRGLRGEIKKRENEQYFTLQTNIRQMCKDVLAKIEEQESMLAEKDKQIAELKEVAEDACLERDDNQNVIDELEAENRRLKRALWMARKAHAVAMVAYWDSHYRDNPNAVYRNRTIGWLRNRWLLILDAIIKKEKEYK